MPRTISMRFAYSPVDSCAKFRLYLSMLKNTFILILATLLGFSCKEEKQNVDLILHNAKIYSVDSSFTIYEAMAVKEGRIVELNSSEEILKKYHSQTSTDL